MHRMSFGYFITTTCQNQDPQTHKVMYHSAVFQIPPPRLGSTTEIRRNQAADIVIIIHFLFFLLFFLFLLSLSCLSFSCLSFPHPPPSTRLHSTPTTTLTLARSLLIIVHQKRGPVALLTPTCARNQLPLCHLPRTSVNKNLNQPLHGVESALRMILNSLKMLFLSMLNVTNCLRNLLQGVDRRTSFKLGWRCSRNSRRRSNHPGDAAALLGISVGTCDPLTLRLVRTTGLTGATAATTSLLHTGDP